MPTTYWVNGNSYTLPDGISDEEATRLIAADQAKNAATPGNINLHARPVVNNPDGSISTVRSKSFGIDGKEVLLPTVSDDGRIMSDAETMDTYRRTGKHLGIFNSPDEATAYAQKLHEQQAAEYAKPSVADVARQRLASRGLTTADVKAGRGVTSVDPTVGERVKSGAGALVSGLGDLASGVVVGLPESAVNIATALPRSAYASVDALAHGGSLADAFNAAKNVQPHHETTEALSTASTNLGRATTRALGGVRPGVDTDVQDAALRLAPTAVAMGKGGIDTIRGLRGATVATPDAIPVRPDVEAAHVPEAPPAPTGEPAGPPAADLQALADKAGRAQATARPRVSPVDEMRARVEANANRPLPDEAMQSMVEAQRARDAQVESGRAATDRNAPVTPGRVPPEVWDEMRVREKAIADATTPEAKSAAIAARDALRDHVETNPEWMTQKLDDHGITVADEHPDLAVQGRLAYQNPDGSIVHVTPEEVRQLSVQTEQPVPDIAGAAPDITDRPTGGEPALGPDAMAVTQPRFGEDQAGGQAGQAGVGETPEQTAARRAAFERWMDTTDTHGNPVTPEAAPTGGAPAGPRKPSVAEWMLGGPQEAYPGIAQDLAHMEAQTARRGGEPNAAPPNEPPLIPRGPGEAPVPQNPITAGIRRSTPARLYDRTMPQIVDAIEKQGQAGADTAAKKRAAARFSDQFSAPAIADLKAATKGMTDAQINQVGDIVENFSKDGMPANVDPRVAQAVAVIQRDLNAIKAHALGHVADFTPIEDYLPHVGKAPEDMPANVQNLVQRAGHESGNLTRQRGRNSVRPEGQDLIKALTGYYRGASRYVGELRAFDVADRPALDSALEVAADKAHGEGFDGDLIRRYASKAMGGGQTADPVASKIADTVIAAQAITKPVFAPIRHFQQIRNDLSVFGFGNTLRGTIDTLTQKAGFSPEGARAVLESGAVARDAANDLMQNATTSGPVVNTLRKGASIANAPVRLVDQVKSQLTANAAAHHFAELADLAQGKSVPLARRVNPLSSGFADLRSTPVVQQAARDTLARAGVDVANLKDPAAYRQGMLNYMWQATQDTQKMTNRMGSPAFSMTPWGRVLYTFNRPGAFGTDFVVQRVLKPAAAGDAGPLVRYTIGSLLGYGATEAAVHAIRGKPDEGMNIIKGEATPKQIATFAEKAVLPHGLNADYTIRGLQDKPWLNAAATHAGAAGATVSDLDAIQRAIREKSFAPLLQSEGHARTIKELARLFSP